MFVLLFSVTLSLWATDYYMSEPWLPYSYENPSTEGLYEVNPLLAERDDEHIRAYIWNMYGLQEVLKDEAPLLFWASVLFHAGVVLNNNQLRKEYGYGKLYAVAFHRRF